MRNGYGMFNNYHNFRYNNRNAQGPPFSGNYRQVTPWPTSGRYAGGGNQRYDGRRALQNGYRSNEKPQKFVPNHKWDDEWNGPKDDSPHYSSIGLVVWVEGTKGEIFCNRNVSSTITHFYFDGRTQIDGRTVATAERSEEGLGVFEGTKVEFEAVYKKPDQHEKSPILVHVTKMTVYQKETPSETEPVSMVSFNDEPHAPKFALDKDGDFVLISPVIFSRKWVVDCLNTTVIGAVPEYPEKDQKHTCFHGRTLVGKIITCPRFVGDVIGERLNVKRMMLAFDYAELVIEGYATIRSMVPSQSVIIEADELPGELMFFSLIGLAKTLRQQCRIGTRVLFHACKQLPGFNYPWKVLEAIVTDRPPPPPEAVQEPVVIPRGGPSRGVQDDTPIPEPSKDSYSEMVASLVSLYTPPSTPPPPDMKESSGVPTTSRPSPSKSRSQNDFNNDSSTKNRYLHELEAIFGATAQEAKNNGEMKGSAMDDLMALQQNPMVNGNQMKGSSVHFDDVRGEEDQEDSFDEDEEEEKETGPSPSPYAHLLQSPAYLSLPNSADPETVRLVLGCGYDDAFQEVERCVFPHEENSSWLDEYSHVVETSAEQYAKLMQKTEDRQKRKEERRVLRAEAREERRHQATFKPKPSISVTGIVPLLLPGDCEPPGDEVTVIGFYDDITSIFNAMLVKNEARKKEAEEKRKNPAEEEIDEEKEVEEPKKKPNDGWWFRRRNPRVLPSVVVAELLVGRTEEEICVDYKVDDLTETVVLRNSSFGRTGKEPSPVVKSDAPSHPAASTTVTAVDVSRIEKENRSERVDKEKEQPLPQSPPKENPLAKSLMNDKSFRRTGKQPSPVIKSDAPSHPAASTTVTGVDVSRIDEEKKASESVEKENEQPLPPPPPKENPLAKSLMNDKIFGTFFRSLLKK